ncbi:MAG: hypothetical protein JWN55_446 [Frankiales bacterium]|nr:hypothetical protein [Frankiales bacterium]
MDFVAELVLQFLIQVVFEILAEGAFEVFAKTRLGRLLFGLLVGIGFGLAWGAHLSGGAHWPKLLWVSLVAGVVALVRAMGSPRDGREPRGFWSFITQWPWQWSFDRLLGFSLMNLGIAAGIYVAFPS